MAVGHGPGLGTVQIEGLRLEVEAHGLSLGVEGLQVGVVLAVQEIAEGTQAQALRLVPCLEEAELRPVDEEGADRSVREGGRLVEAGLVDEPPPCLELLVHAHARSGLLRAAALELWVGSAPRGLGRVEGVRAHRHISCGPRPGVGVEVAGVDAQRPLRAEGAGVSHAQAPGRARTGSGQLAGIAADEAATETEAGAEILSRRKAQHVDHAGESVGAPYRRRRPLYHLDLLRVVEVQGGQLPEGHPHEVEGEGPAVHEGQLVARGEARGQPARHVHVAGRGLDHVEPGHGAQHVGVAHGRGAGDLLGGDDTHRRRSVHEARLVARGGHHDDFVARHRLGFGLLLGFCLLRPGEPRGES